MERPSDEAPRAACAPEWTTVGVVELLECIPDPMFIVSPDDGLIVLCNTAAWRWQGAAPAELVGQPFRRIQDESQDGCREDLLAQVRVHGHVFAEQSFLLRNGRTARADLSACVYRWAGQDWIVVHLRDAGQRLAAQRMADELREAAVRERTIARLSHEINNPLQALLLDTAASGDETLRMHAEEIAAVLRKLREEQGDRIGGQAPESPAEPRPPRAFFQGADVRRILVADDHDTIRRTLGLMLREKLPGVQVDLAGDGEEAVSLFKQGHPAVMVLDVMMPRKSGDAVFDDIRAFCRQRNWEEPRIVFCTGYSPPPVVRDEVEAPGSRHLCLLKPVKPASLIQAVVSLVAATEAAR